jgi:Ssp1 endopeptidase immunity protein Rap1a
MKLISLTAVLIILGAVGVRIAGAAPFVTLAQLKLQLDSRQIKDKGKDSEATRAAVAYVLGAADAFEISGDLCFASNASGDDIVAAVATYLHDHVNDEPIEKCLRVGCEASWGVRAALKAKFPCIEVP